MALINSESVAVPRSGHRPTGDVTLGFLVLSDVGSDCMHQQVRAAASLSLLSDMLFFECDIVPAVRVEFILPKLHRSSAHVLARFSAALQPRGDARTLVIWYEDLQGCDYILWR